MRFDGCGTGAGRLVGHARAWHGRGAEGGPDGTAGSVSESPDQFALAAEFIGRTADAWRRRALAAEAAAAVASRDRDSAIARLAELTAVLRPDIERDEAGHCDCCFRARRVLTASQAEVIPLRAADANGDNAARAGGKRDSSS